MGLLSKIFGNKTHTEAKVERHTEEQQCFEIPGIFHGMIVDVVADDGSIIFEAKVKEYNSLSVTFFHIDGFSDIPVLEKAEAEDGARVLFFRGISDEHKAVNFSGVIKESNPKMLRVGDLSLISYSEHREEFRLLLMVESEVIIQPREKMLPVTCLIKDVSVGGARLELSQALKENTPVSVKIPFVKEDDGMPIAEMNLQGYVIRVTERPNDVYEYGVKFISLSDSLRSELLSHLYGVQLQWRKQRRAYEEGHF